MLTQKDAAIVYETLLSSPGMSDKVKISLQLPRKNVLLLARLIELGLSVKESERSELVNILSKDADGVSSINGQLLQKAGLNEMYERLTALEAK